jgi:hypothetical protein
VANRVFLHVGLPKSGTTFLQAVLSDNKRALKDAGLLFPGAGGWKNQVRAVRDIREMPHVRFRHRKVVPGAWDRLAREIRAWPGDSVISMEWLSRAEPHQVQRIMDSLESHEIHVVFTVRDLARVLPASWQESIVNRMQWTWPEFLAQTADEDVPGEERKFWRLHDLVPLIARWTPAVPAEHVHVITVPPAGTAPEELWHRFAGVLGVAGVPVEIAGVRRNEGLGLASTELLRRVNIRSRRAKLSPTAHSKLVSHGLAKQGLSQVPQAPYRPRIPADLHPWVLARYEQQVAGLAAAGVELVGDLEDLRPDLDRHNEAPPEPDPDAMLELAVEGLVIMAKQRAQYERSAQRSAAAAQREMVKLQRRYARLERVHEAQVARWQARPVRSAVGVLARRSRLAVRIVRRLRRLRAGS